MSAGQDDVADSERRTADVGIDPKHGLGEKHQPLESSTASVDDQQRQQETPQSGKKRSSSWRRTYDTLTWCPPNMRWDPHRPPKFSMALNVLFGFAAAFTVANLYYSHPILNILAHDFNVPYVRVSNIPTLAQAGYATGLLFLCPLGDAVERRPFVLGLVFFTATMSIALATTSSIQVFSAIQFLTGVSTVTPQLMLPLVGDLAPPKRRAAALSIVVSGLMLGILIARLLSGIMTQYTSWRYVYWLSVALQYAIFILLWFFMPDYPATNKGGLKGLRYFKMLWSILPMLARHPVLVQACLISFFTSATFTNFWTILTFLLAGPPYYYDSVVIGLFALVGIGSMICGPFYARIIIDRFVPAFSVLLGMLWCLLGISLGTYTGTFTVAGPILQAFFNDFGMQTAQIANRSAIFSVEPKARNRVNTAFMVATFAGQLVGTSVGAHLYAKGGWIASGSYSMGSIGVALLITLARGPWEEGWIGWHGGWSIKKKAKDSADGKSAEPKSGITTEQQKVRSGELAKAEEGQIHKDHHQHRHGHDNQHMVNATEAEKNLEMLAAESDDEKWVQGR
ncbi:Major Facilitator Superfamily [Teratosphaeria destructans]|uniref:Major Facilitator Superfamily n=1 Tax=Teratosphaeria destructans TaxID=418781 RepID=A0A9W7W0R6_9PEZI|nr:Major Facilitator Superfamily [Teratosphaeria destructans]